MPGFGIPWGIFTIGMGKPDEAISFFKKAVELASNVSVHHIALAVCYSLLGLSDEARQEIVLARRNSDDQESYIKYLPGGNARES